MKFVSLAKMKIYIQIMIIGIGMQSLEVLLMVCDIHFQASIILLSSFFQSNSGTYKTNRRKFARQVTRGVLWIQKN